MKRFGRRPEQVVLVAVLDVDADDVALAQMARVAKVDFTVDLRSVGLRPAGRTAALGIDRVDNDVEFAPDLGG